jgi:hypothetical protein
LPGHLNTHLGATLYQTSRKTKSTKPPSWPA